MAVAMIAQRIGSLIRGTQALEGEEKTRSINGVIGQLYIHATAALALSCATSYAFAKSGLTERLVTVGMRNLPGQLTAAALVVSLFVLSFTSLFKNSYINTCKEYISGRTRLGLFSIAMGGLLFRYQGGMFARAALVAASTGLLGAMALRLRICRNPDKYRTLATTCGALIYIAELTSAAFSGMIKTLANRVSVISLVGFMSTWTMHTFSDLEKHAGNISFVGRAALICLISSPFFF